MPPKDRYGGSAGTPTLTPIILRSASVMNFMVFGKDAGAVAYFLRTDRIGASVVMLSLRKVRLA